ncbi:MAG: T9SS type A sorting domain-containing protein [Bacteroidota bacterium]
MKNFTFFIMAGFLLITFSLSAQSGLVGLYTFSDSQNLFLNTATEPGIGTTMCEGVMKFLPDAPSGDEDDQPSIEGTDWEVVSGVNDNAIALKAHNWFKVWHGIPANGGGDYVNEYTFVIDFRIADTSVIYSLVEVNPTPKENGYTSEVEIVGGKVGSVGAPASGADPLGFSENILTTDEWHRVVYAAKLSEYIEVYVDGVLWNSMEGDFTDARPALYGSETDPDDAAVKLCGNNEQFPINDPARDGDKDIDLLAVFNRTLEASEIYDLGGAGSWTGIEDEIALNNVSMYPNPASSILTITEAQGSTVDIINITGQIVKSVIIEGEISTIDVSLLNSGIYFVRITHNRTSYTQKLIIE